MNSISKIMSIGIACATFSSGCGKANAPSLDSPQKLQQTPIKKGGSIESVYDDLQTFDGIGMTTPRDQKFYPENILPRINAWLQVGIGFSRITIEGHEAIILNKMSSDDVDQLKQALYTTDFPSGFAILQAQFWKMIQQGQENGYTYGFLEPDPKFLVAGVNFTEKKLILFDVFANQGVFIHEMRHSLQYDTHQKRLMSKKSIVSSILKEKCISEVSQFIQEVDATTEELSTWKGVLSTINPAPEWHQSKKITTLEPLIPTIVSVFYANLGYPEYASAWVNPKDCPLEINNAVNEIGKRTYDFQFRVIEPISCLVGGAVNRDLWDHIGLNEQCLDKPNALQNICEDYQHDLNSIQEETPKRKALLEIELSKETLKRRSDLAEIINKIPDNMKEELCWNSSGFEFMADCTKYFAEKK